MMRSLFLTFAGIALLAGGLFAANEPRFVFSKSFPNSVPAYEQVVLDRSGAAEYREAEDDELPLKFNLTESETQTVFDLAASGLRDEVLVGDDPESAHWRSQFLYSRAATIYGGSAEIQRNIIARRLLDLGADR